MARVGISTNEVELDSQFLRNAGTLAGQILPSQVAPGVSIAKIGQVTGIRLDHSIIGAIAVKWTRVLNAQSYEIQAGIDKTFIEDRFETFNVGGHKTSWIFTHGNPDKEYYIRIRARNAAGDVGDWSGLLNSRTGVVEANHLVGGSTGNIITYTFIDFPDPYLGGGINYVYLHPNRFPPNVWETKFGNAKFQSFGGLVFIFIAVDADFRTSYTSLTGLNHWTNLPEGPGYLDYPTGQFVVIEIWMDGEFIEKNYFGRTQDSVRITGCLTKGTPLVMGLPTLPGVGIHEYSIRIVLAPEIILEADGSVRSVGEYYDYEAFGVDLHKVTMAIFEKIR